MPIQQTKDHYKEVVETIDFVADEEMAEEAIKAVLGILSSKVSEQEAREFTANLPDYLSYEVLRGHQVNPAPATPSDTIDIVSDKFDLKWEQARKLMMEIIGVAKQQASGEISGIAAELSDDWREAIDEA